MHVRCNLQNIKVITHELLDCLYKKDNSKQTHVIDASLFLVWSKMNLKNRKTGLEISARPLAQASVKTVGRVQINYHSPGLASTISYP